MSALLQLYDRDLVLVSGRGCRVVDDSGKSYLDLTAGIAVNALGHGDPKLVAAIRKQAGRLIHASNLYHNEPASALAERLVSLAFPSRVFFCNSGAESVEAALKFARRLGRTEGRSELVAFEGSFHGRTLGALSLTSSARYREPFEPLVPGVRFCPWNDLDAARQAVGSHTAAVIVEPVQGEAGVRPADTAFLQGLGALCHERGALLIADEVQCGLGRTGRLFAYEHFDIRPDLLTLAKPLGGGLPLGAVLVREELAPGIARGDHGSTFGGNPVAAAAALVVLDRLGSHRFLAGVKRKGALLQKGLARLAVRCPGVISEVRGLGLMLGIELERDVAPVLTGLRARGILAAKAGDRVLRLVPPLVIKRSELEAFLVAFEQVLEELAGAAA